MAPMIHYRGLLVVPLALVAAIAFGGTQPVTTRPAVLDIISAADSILVQRLGHEAIPHCEGALTDSLRFTHCYPVLEQGVAHRPDWRSDLARILGSKTVSWNHDSCGYDPQAVLRFLSPDHPAELVVFTSRCDTSRVGLLMLRLGSPMEYAGLGQGGAHLLDLLSEAVPVNGVHVRARREPAGPAEGEFVEYDEPPTPVTQFEPAPSEFANEGKVIMHALVGADGRVKDVRVIRGVEGLDDLAIASARKWIFRPATAQGKPVAVWVEIPMDFRH
jgi:TonB family protein